MRSARYVLKLTMSSLSAASENHGDEQGLWAVLPVDLIRLRSLLYPTPRPAESVGEEVVVDQVLTPASVLFPIVLRESEPTVLLTQRTLHLKDHPGQISFPGGRVEAEDVSPAHTALRESEEEIGLASRYVEVIGYLPEYRTVTGFCVTPVVGLVAPSFELRLDAFEVAEAFEVPLAFLLNPANHQRHSVEFQGMQRQYYAMTYQQRYIWGATAGIIVSLSRMIYKHT